MNNINEFVRLVKAFVRLMFTILLLKIIGVFPYIGRIKQLIVSRYYKWKFPYIAQYRRLIGDELQVVHNDIIKIRTSSKNLNLSRSQLKKHKAMAYNSERAYMELNKLMNKSGIIYKLDK